MLENFRAPVQFPVPIGSDISSAFVVQEFFSNIIEERFNWKATCRSTGKRHVGLEKFSRERVFLHCLSSHPTEHRSSRFLSIVNNSACGSSIV